jgi:MFS family permease
MEPIDRDGPGAGGGARQILSNPSVAAVILIAFVIMLGAGIVLPTLPLFGRSFGVGYGAAGILIAAFGFARLVADLAAGVIVDRLGERVAGAAGLVLLAAFSILTGLASSFALAVVFWGAVGASSAIVQAANFVHLIRVVPAGLMGRTFGLFYGAFNVGLAFGGFIGGFLAGHAGLASPLYANAALAIVATLLYLRFVPGTQRGGVHTATSRVGRRLARLLRTEGLAAALSSQLAYLWMFAALFGTLIPLFGRDVLDMSPAAIGVVFAVGLLVELVVLYPAGSAADRFGRKRLLVPGMTALAALTVALGWAGSALGLGFLVVLLCIASGVGGTVPSAMLSDVAGKEDSGMAVGVFRFSGDLGWALGPLVAGFVVNEFGFTEAFAASAVPAAVAVAIVLRTRETLRPAVEQG